YSHHNTTITDSYLGYSGLELDYVYFCKEYSVDLERDETINYLDSAGIITYKDGMVLDEDRWISYEDWRNENELTESDYKDIVILLESAKKMKAATNRIMNPKAA